ncbi:MAG: ABC transporter permease [Proteocatella sp.]
MVSLLQCEFMKLKRSKMTIISILGAMVNPFMILVEILKERSNNPDVIVTYSGIFSQSNMYMILIFGLIVYTVFASYLFGREYTENTLKTILTIPVSKSSLLISKFLTLIIWCVGLSILSWFFCLIVGLLANASELNMTVVLSSLFECSFGTLLLVLMFSPIVFITIWTKGIVIPVITSATIVMFNAALTNENIGALFPWTSIYLVASNRILETGYPVILSVSLILFTIIVGFSLCFYYFNKEDIK